MSAMESLLAGLIDYAGLYPPANLDMRSAVLHYLEYEQSEYAYALGRFIVSLNRLEEFKQAAGKDAGAIRVSVLVPAIADFDEVSTLGAGDVQIESVEVKLGSLSDIDCLEAFTLAGLETYVELPVEAVNFEALEAVARVGAHVKLRMGGVVPDAFPSLESIAAALMALARCRLAFKATAGLHHPFRSCHPLTYAHDSPRGMMHGFINLLAASALIHFGGTAGEAGHILEEEDSHAWQLSPGSLTWRRRMWSAGQLQEVRKRFFTSFGSCSFEEPIRDLEAQGWL
jgi:hypothetical protein